jgi:hypothetical protein
MELRQELYWSKNDILQKFDVNLFLLFDRDCKIQNSQRVIKLRKTVELSGQKTIKSIIFKKPEKKLEI